MPLARQGGCSATAGTPFFCLVVLYQAHAFFPVSTIAEPAQPELQQLAVKYLAHRTPPPMYGSVALVISDCKLLITALLHCPSSGASLD